MPIKEIAIKVMNKWQAITVSDKDGGYKIVYFKHVAGDSSLPQNIGQDMSQAHFTAIADHTESHEGRHWGIDLMSVQAAKTFFSGKVHSTYLPVTGEVNRELEALWDKHGTPLLFGAAHPMNAPEVNAAEVEKLAKKIAYRFDNYYEKTFRSMIKAKKKIDKKELARILMEILAKRYQEEHMPLLGGTRDRVLDRALILVMQKEENLDSKIKITDLHQYRSLWGEK